MEQRINYSHCPVCGSQDIHPALKVKDHSVSQEMFEIWQCVSCTLRFTQDVPNQASIGAYYQSEDYISHSNTSKGLINQLYKMVRKRTMAGKFHIIQKFTGKSTGSLLDVGAGTGSFVKYMKDHGYVVAKADLSQITNRIKSNYPYAEFLNGIAYDSTTKKIYVTGKHWPELYEIQLGQ